VTKRGWFLFSALSFIWGTPYLMIRVAMVEVSPAVMVFTRLVLGSALLLPWAMRQGTLGVIKTHWKPIMLFGLIEMAFPWAAIGFAEQKISSSLAALLIATVPMINGLIAKQMKLDLDWDVKRVVGIAVGLGGVATLVGLDVKADSWWAVAACMITVIGYSTAPILISSKLADVPSSGIITLGMIFVALLYLPIVAWQIHDGSWHTGTVHTNTWLALVWLGVVCTAIAFIAFFALIDEVGPIRSSLITYINPAVAVILGVLFLSEPITTGLMLGFPLVILGSYLATRKPVQV
jgi:drug/metabolite transporter (DMT)-like permease